jgi:hypothetical protein
MLFHEARLHFQLRLRVAGGEDGGGSGLGAGQRRGEPARIFRQPRRQPAVGGGVLRQRQGASMSPYMTVRAEGSTMAWRIRKKRV